ncbi:MAG: bifunctional UDP-sugar hydrolase/5'-nucleotidase [Candidatus Micrarchaeia archaeon]
MKREKFTILHSNDIHGDFLSESGPAHEDALGGLALLSGYINKVRKEEKNVLYVVSGDMVQGSLIDSEYKGISTVEIMNYLAPDVVSLGNHEFDYGLPHLLFLEKMANFPIVNSNLYIKKYYKRLMKPFHIIEKAGLSIMFIGIITEKILDSLKGDSLVGSFITLEEASSEVGKITDSYKNDDIDLTVLLTHIGHESDIELAKMLRPEWGVDMIIGGHSHTVLSEPARVNNILIAQAGVGSDHIGRFDITVDDDTNSIVDYKWRLVDIKGGIAEPDLALSQYIKSYKDIIDRKYNSLICRLVGEATHPQREVETSLGNLIADAFAEIAECDIMLVGSGSIRAKSLGPMVTLGDVQRCFPYDDSLNRFEINGKQLRKIFRHIMRPENRNSEGECYQVNSGVKAVYSAGELELSVGGKPVSDSGFYRICMQGYHMNNCKPYLDISLEELRESGKSKVVSTSAQGVLQEYLSTRQNLAPKLEGRLAYS